MWCLYPSADAWLRAGPARDKSPPAAPLAPFQRDNNGSLLCSECKEPYPYADPPSDLAFVCRSCLSYKGFT